MLTGASYLLTFLSSLLAIPVGVLLVEIVAAIALPRREPDSLAEPIRPQVAVLVPAHNEGGGLLPTIEDVKAQLRPGDRLLVVADNCSDDTAAIATAAGAEVIVRNDDQRIGKGYALDWGLRHLSNDPPETVIIIDADCRLGLATIEHLTAACTSTRRPVQALNLMVAPDQSPIEYQVAEFAWRVKNWLRPQGLNALGLPCQLSGTGMAFPWDAIRSANVANASLVEDLMLGLDLAAARHPPLFCPSACVTSRFASSLNAAGIQRARWERGHINTILSMVPRLLGMALARGNWALLALTLDLAVPPLSLLGMIVAGMSILAGLSIFFGLSSMPLFVAISSLLVFSLAVLLAWLKCGRDILPARSLLSISPYMLAKLGLYWHVLSGNKKAQWIRTDRTKSGQ